jgi:hypothetical protein
MIASIWLVAVLMVTGCSEQKHPWTLVKVRFPSGTSFIAAGDLNKDEEGHNLVAIHIEEYQIKDEHQALEAAKAIKSGNTK